MDTQKRTILLVDDEQFILRAVANLLRDAGHRVHTCDEWMSIPRIVSTEKPDLVLMDYNMPVLRGDELVSVLRRNAVDESMRILLFSSEPEMDLMRIARSCGADGYIRKSLPSDQLVVRVHEELGLPV